MRQGDMVVVMRMEITLAVLLSPQLPTHHPSSHPRHGTREGIRILEIEHRLSVFEEYLQRGDSLGVSSQCTNKQTNIAPSSFTVISLRESFHWNHGIVEAMRSHDTEEGRLGKGSGQPKKNDALFVTQQL
jgi:hypothetical protein